MSYKDWQKRRLSTNPRTGEVRSEWERDYARLIHSSAFRRLQSKTQVLGLGESDFYRTRLTHSMEVAQIGSGIVRFLEDKYSKEKEIIDALPDFSLISSICLAHDIGHPPFGHGGEVALNFCMKSHGGFEGNGQTLRILSKLEKYSEKHGLNPTRRMLLGVLKYPASYSSSVNSKYYGKSTGPRWQFKADTQKPPKCYYDCDREVVNWILEPLLKDERFAFTQTFPEGSETEPKHSKPKYKSLDTSIMELADDISFSLHDFEDAISLGMIRRIDWLEHNEGYEELFTNCGKLSNKLADDLFHKESHFRKGCIGELVHLFITNTEVKLSGIDCATTPIIKWNAYLNSTHKKLLDHIFKLVKNRVIKNENVQQLEFKGQKMIVELFDVLNSDPERLLPNATKIKYLSLPKEDDDSRVRVICDFISGMTDVYATRLYEKIFYPHKGSIFDHL